MVQLFIALILILISLYFIHVKKDLRLPSITAVLVHIFAVWGLYTLGIKRTFILIAILSVTFIFAVSTVIYLFQTMRDSENRQKFKTLVKELYSYAWDVLEGRADPVHFVIQFNKTYDLAKFFADKEDKEVIEKILNLMKSQKEAFASPELVKYALLNKIPKSRWWFYLYELIKKDATSI